MKTQSNLAAIRVTISICLLSFGIAFCGWVSGCHTAPETTAYRISGTARVTAESAMRAWGDYVSKNHPPVAQELKVQHLFDSYKAAQLALLDSAIAYSQASTNVAAQPGAQAQLDRAVATASAALTDLTVFLSRLGVKLEQ